MITQAGQTRVVKEGRPGTSLHSTEVIERSTKNSVLFSAVQTENLFHIAYNHVSLFPEVGNGSSGPFSQQRGLESIS